LVADVLERLVSGAWGDPARLESWEIEPLADIFLANVRDGEQMVIRDLDYLRVFGVAGSTPINAAALWRHIAQSVGPLSRSADPSVRPAVNTLLEQGPLARRILAALGPQPSRDKIAAVYRELADCLAAGRMFARLE
jgi:glutamate---cysteine ligase / carboxylate-amine ligase